METLRRTGPHTSRSATAPRNLPMSDAPALPLPRTRPLAAPHCVPAEAVVDRHGGQSHVLHTAPSPAARVESAQTRKARSLSERFRNDWICRANLSRQNDQVTSSAKRLISAIGAGIPRHLCSGQAPASLGCAETKIAPVPIECGCVAVCPIGDIVPVVTAKTGSRAFLLSRIGHPAYIRTSALRVLSNARAP